ncbi:MAG: GxxExxY protein [Bacteroidota bacterium]
MYKGETLDADFRVDLLVEHEIIVELKSVETLLPVHEAQLLTYMKLMDKHLGLLINFNVPKLVDGFRRRVLNF